MTELEDRIIALIREQSGTDRSVELGLDTRLVQDVGMDGDDASEFFERFSETFQVDLSALQAHWSQHFSSEGCGGPPLGCLVVIGGAVTLGGLLHLALSGVPAWVLIAVLTIVLGFACARLFNYYENEKPSVTVQDLVDAATSGRWIKPY